MAFRLEHLHRVFGAENEIGFDAWAYATRDPLGRVLGKGYFQRCQSRLKAGDLIFCASDQPAPRAPAQDGLGRQRSLLLVLDVAWDGIVTRLVQDIGALEDSLVRRPALPAALAGEVVALKGGQDFHLAVGEGFVQVTSDRVAIMTDMAIKAEDIDENKAEEARKRAEARLKEKLGEEETDRLTKMLEEKTLEHDKVKKYADELSSKMLEAEMSIKKLQDRTDQLKEETKQKVT